MSCRGLSLQVALRDLAKYLKIIDGPSPCNMKTPNRAPKANTICEYILGSVRRECLDDMVILGESNSNRIMKEYGILQPGSDASKDRSEDSDGHSAKGKRQPMSEDLRVLSGHWFSSRLPTDGMKFENFGQAKTRTELLPGTAANYRR